MYTKSLVAEIETKSTSLQLQLPIEIVKIQALCIYLLSECIANLCFFRLGPQPVMNSHWVQGNVTPSCLHCLWSLRLPLELAL